MPRGKSNLDPENRRAALLAGVTYDPSGCWLWHGQTLLNGYGTMRVNRKLRYVHRISYELHVGPIPDGLQIDHLCRVRHCVNPAHLEPVTNAENGYRGQSPAGLNKRKTHCSAGHPYDDENTYRTPEGHRHCRTCIKARTQARTARYQPKPRKRVTHCPQGHEYTPENTLVQQSGSRSCRECGRAVWRRWYAEKGRAKVIEKKRRQREAARASRAANTAS